METLTSKDKDLIKTYKKNHPKTSFSVIKVNGTLYRSVKMRDEFGCGCDKCDLAGHTKHSKGMCYGYVGKTEDEEDLTPACFLFKDDDAPALSDPRYFKKIA